MGLGRSRQVKDTLRSLESQRESGQALQARGHRGKQDFSGRGFISKTALTKQVQRVHETGIQGVKGEIEADAIRDFRCNMKSQWA